MVKRPIVVLLVLAVGVGAVVARQQLRKRRLVEQGRSVAPEAMAAKFHSGEAPCLRYPPELNEPPSAFKATAERLDAAGVSSDELADVLGHFLIAHREREVGFHEQRSVDEYLDQLGEQQVGPLSKVAFWLQRDLLRQQLEKVVGDANGTIVEHEVRGEERWRALPAPKQQALSVLDSEAPLMLDVSRLVRVLEALKPLTTRRRAKALVEKARAAQTARPGFPVRLADLQLAEPERTDAWGRDLELLAVGSTIEVRSSGAEDLDDADDIVERGGDVEAPMEPACGALGSTFVLRRRELPDTPEGVRVVPSLKEGRPRGFRLFGITKGSLADRAGLCNGDVIRFANGVDVSTAEKGLAAWGRARQAKQVVLTVERRGLEGELTIELRE